MGQSTQLWLPRAQVGSLKCYVTYSKQPNLSGLKSLYYRLN